jgi:kynureninase
MILTNGHLPEAVKRADAADLLGGFRQRFCLPSGVIYLDGNSLGALPGATLESLRKTVMEEWGRDLITSWNAHNWIGAPQRVGAKIARLIGAKSNEVVVADSTSVNLFKLLVAAVRRQRGRTTILTEPGNFPTDLYVAQGVAQMLPEIRVETAPADAIIDAIDTDTAVVLLTHVHYKSGRRYDMARITEAAHRKGALVIWDLSHSAGAIPVNLNLCGADFAVGCGYKYLNGGPGAPAFLFVAERLLDEVASPISGWMGHARPFAFVDDYHPAPGIDRFLCGTPPVIGLKALEIGVDLLLETDLGAISDKARALSELFMTEIEPLCEAHGMTIITPRNFDDRGSHVALAHPEAYEICQALIARGVIGDFRAPDILRLGFTPLYTSFGDVWRAAQILGSIMDGRLWDCAEYRKRALVT